MVAIQRTSPRNLILHAGTHKTGTTTVQKVLFDHREALRQKGLFYPVEAPFPGDRGQHNFAHALAKGGKAPLQKARRYVARLAESGAADETVILSSEPLYRHVADDRGWAGLVAPDYWEIREAYVARLAEVLSGFDVTLILYFRDYGYFLAWLHKAITREHVWQGSPQEFKAAFGERFAYDRQLALMARHFDRIRTFRYEDALDTGLVQHFFAGIGYTAPEGAGPVWERPTRNRIVPV